MEKPEKRGFGGKLWMPGSNSESYCNMRYELTLTDANNLEGEQFHDNAPSKKGSFYRANRR